ncbi:MAG: ATP-binding protein [Gemmataceae bacterium]|nr:ATP-binding protein [Gemmataceae bacterium]
MKPVAFRVQMYRSVSDSGWIEINPMTVLVGKNESGKTTLLKALHKFNPFSPEPYTMDSEWPRGLLPRPVHGVGVRGEGERWRLLQVRPVESPALQFLQRRRVTDPG